MMAMRSAKYEPDIAHPTEEEVRAYLRLLLERTEFNTSERNKRFLTYVVEETLGGRADRIKAYNIALAAFDRSEDFDPLVDPIVRIEASRLRRSLEHYYLTAGQSDRIRIDVPKGSYVASFTYRNQASCAPEQAATRNGAPSTATVPHPVVAFERRARKFWVPAMAALFVLAADIVVDHVRPHGSRDQVTEVAGKLSISVLPFENTDGDRARAFVARGLTYQLILGLTRFDDMAVFGPEPDGAGDRKVRASVRSDFALFGSIQSEANVVRVTAILSDSQTGQFLRSWSFERDTKQSSYAALQSDIAREIVLAVRQLCATAAEPNEAGLKEFSNVPISYDCGRQTYIASN